jgi:hypothetical protein
MDVKNGTHKFKKFNAGSERRISILGLGLGLGDVGFFKRGSDYSEFFDMSKIRRKHNLKIMYKKL